MSESCHSHGPVEAVSDARTAADDARDALLAEACGLGATMSAAMDAQPGFVPCGHAFSNLIEGLYASAACDDADVLADVAQGVRGRSEHVAGHRGVPMGKAGLAEPATPEAALLLAALRGIAADAYAGMRRGRMSDEVNVLLANALRALGEGTVGHELLTRAGAAALKARELTR